MKTKTSLLILLTALGAIVTPLYAEAATSPDVPDPNQEFTLTGAGATFPFPLIDLWRVEYNNVYNNVNLNYQSIGSGGGIKQHIEKTVNFAASDKPMSQKERDIATGTLHIPESIGGVTVVYNLPEVPNKGLKLTAEAVSKIFLGEITRWNDPIIASQNPGLNLPDHEIVTAHRSDGSGTTFIFTDYLATVSPKWDEQIGKGKSVPWPSGLAAAGNEGVAGIVKSTEYSIGYIELAYAFQTGMSFASIQNADKTAFIEPTLDSISAASSGVADTLPSSEDSWVDVSLVNAPGSDSYPIASFTYLLVYDDLKSVTDSKAQAKAVIHMIYWMITDGQEFSSSLLYVPLADKVVELGKHGLSQVTYDGETLWNYEADASTDLGIPQWIRDNAKWWSEGLITDQDYINGLQYLIQQGILKV
ncbi:phosphate ABC transporter substrate-binding protein PstS [Nitrosopumilus sp.]|uniref:phosphate ABC transporter substrate-binding protein PstS n=1 Tax=Nitrosopumilus sp. TaxID=2024843 RepID=UPI00247CCFBC|nr:phosphate ABC transporter substrate-binding protein PstS [Nitrosopumilus sp.]MCV0430438.1 phosphate ABC transporter substrate-binding protein PstS [Nitrosopumilus sp.]